MFKKSAVYAICACLILSILPIGSRADTLHVSRDAGGWTAVAPSADSRQIRVSSSAGNDANDGLSDANPVKTLSRAMSLLRNGYPDWLMLKAGDVWTENLGGVGAFGGRSADEPMVITSYGTGAKPQIRPAGSGNTEIFHHGDAGTSGHLYFIGLDFYDPRKDPQSPSFSGSAPDANGLAWIGGGNDILVENCDFRFLAGGVVFQQYNSGAITNLTLRRNRFLDGYSFNSGSMSQAAFIYGVDGLLVEENVFDHNGWNAAAGAAATVFNHNIYIDECKNAVVRKNFFFRAASLSVKFRSDHALASTNTLVEDNLIFESEVGLGAAADGGVGVPAQATLTGFTIKNNVILQTNRDNPTGRGLGWGISLNDIKDSTVTGNIISDLSFSGNSFGISLGDGMETPVDYPVSNVSIASNILYRVNGPGLSLRPGSVWSGVTVSGNSIQNPDQNQGLAVWCRCTPTGKITFSGNNYYNQATPSAFAWVGGSVTGAPADYSGWVAKSVETGSTNAKINYPDPSRNLETYMQSVGGTATVDAFIAAMRSQTKGNWQSAYTATAVNDYVRAGFGVAALGSAPATNPPPVVNYALSYAAGAHGALTGSASQTVNAGASGSAVTAVADAGYHFVAWSDGSTQNPRTDANVSSGLAVSAGFAVNVYTLNYLSGGNGTITGAATQTVNYLANGTAVTAMANNGYHFVNWSDASTQNPRTDAAVSGNVSVTANFAADAAAPSAGGSSSSGGASSGSGGAVSTPVPATTPAPGSGTSQDASGVYVPSAALAGTPNINADKGLKNSGSSLCAAGSLIKASYPSVYYCGADGKRYVFANDRVYFSWYDDFSSVQMVSDAAMAATPLGGNVTYRPGRRMVKIQTDPKVYVVAHGGTLRWVPSEAKARELYGANWNQLIDDIPDSFFADYTVGAPL